MTMKIRITIAVFIASLMVSAMPVLADDFELRNGIMFGDSISDVQNKETLKTERKTEDDETVLSTPDGGTIAGIDDSKVYYTFNEDNELYDMRYYFYEDAFDKISDGLVRKYEDPVADGIDDSEEILLTRTSALTAAAKLNSMYGMLGDNMEILGFSQWIVDCEDYSVKIDLIEMNFYNSSKPYDYYTLVGYRKVTDEEIAEKEADQEAIDQDL